MMPPQVAVKRAQVRLAVIVIAITLGVNSLILLSPDATSKSFFGNLLAPILAGGATAFSLKVVHKQGLNGKFGRAFLGFALGLVLFSVAETIWGYYSLILGIQVPFPSIADALWLAGYLPFGYGLFTLSKMYRRRDSKKLCIIFSIIGAALCGYYVQSLIASSGPITPDNEVGLGITISYPILDTILIIPSLMAVISSGQGYLTSIPWIFLSWILAAIADTIFGFATMMNTEGVDFTSSLFYNAEYIAIGAGMFWHYRYMIFDSKRYVSSTIT